MTVNQIDKITKENEQLKKKLAMMVDNVNKLTVKSERQGKQIYEFTETFHKIREKVCNSCILPLLEDGPCEVCRETPGLEYWRGRA